MPFGPRLPFAHRVTQEVAQRFVTADGKSAEVLAFEAARRDPAPALPDVRALSAVWCGAFLLDRAREDSTVCGEIGRKLLKKTLNPRTATTPAIFLGRALVMWAALLLPEGRGTEWDSYDREISELLTLDPSYRGALNACAGLALAEHDPRIEPPPGIVTGLLLARGLGEPFTAKDIKTHRDTAGLFFISEALRQVVWRALDDGQWTRAAPGLRPWPSRTICRT